MHSASRKVTLRWDECARSELSPGWPKIDGFAGAGRLDADAGQGVVAGPVIGQPWTARIKHRALDLAEPPPFILHTRLRGGNQNQRWRIGLIRDEGLRCASPEHDARRDCRQCDAVAAARTCR